MKKTLLAFAAALALAGCSKEELVPGGDQLQNAVAFNTYVGSSAQTRATVVNTSYIEVNGFGVNAYYTGTSNFDAETDYSAENNAVFMDNTKVSFNSEKGEWTYSPIKYWPNNSGDMLSFFAYAPYNSSQIDFIGTNKSELTFYVDSDVKNQVDLIYHPANGNDEKGCEKTINLTKPSVTSKVSFNFQHALSRITFDVKAVVDEVNADGDNLLDGNTRVNIKKVALVNTDADYETTGAEGSFYTTGVLNLADGTWAEEGGEQGFEFDGSNFYRSVEDNEETVAQLTKFNPAQTLLAEDSYLMIIPQDFSTDGYRIYIEYDVISEEINNNGSNENTTNDSNTITNKIYSQALTTNFEAGKAYKFTLLLGMTSVKFTADVAPWEDANNEDEEQWMPENTSAALSYNSADNIFEIYNEFQLATMRNLVNDGSTYTVDADGNVTTNEPTRSTSSSYATASYKLMDDIDLSRYDNWEPIGNSTNKFQGNFNGNGKTITGLNISYDHNSTSENAIGLFGQMEGTYGSYLNIENINLQGTITVAANGTVNVGGIAGYAEYVTISNCHLLSNSNLTLSSNDAEYANTMNYMGGIVGDAATVNVIASSNNAAFTNNIGGNINRLGGIAGCLIGNIVACYNLGTLTRSETSGEIGGIVGSFSESTGFIKACYNTGDFGKYIAGSFFSTTENTIIENCYSVYAEENDFIGENYLSSVSNCGTVTDSDWTTPRDAMNNALIELYEDGTNPQYNLKYVESTTTAPLTLESGVAEYVNLPYTSFEKAEESVNEVPTLYIKSVEDLIGLAHNVNNGFMYDQTYSYAQLNYIQTADIDLSSVCSEALGSWTPIGNYEKPFKGTYSVDVNTNSENNAHYVIKNLYISVSDEETEYQGLFGYVSNAVMKDIRVESGTVKFGADKSGAVIGAANYTSIEGCSYGGTVLPLEYDLMGGLGGVIGYANGNGNDRAKYAITDCYFDGSYKSGWQGGCVLGEVRNTLVKGCYTTNNATASFYGPSNGSYTGGVIGEAWWCDIVDCWNQATISMHDSKGNIGGIVGYVNNCNIVACYNTGKISGKNVAGISGWLTSNSLLIRCFNSGELEGTDSKSGISYANVGGNSVIYSCYNSGTFSGNGGAYELYTYNNSGSGTIYETTYYNCFGETNVIVSDCFTSSTNSTYYQIGENVKWYNESGTTETDVIYAMEKLNSTYNDVSNAYYSQYQFVVNTDDATKDAMPLVLKYTASGTE